MGGSGKNGDRNRRRFSKQTGRQSQRRDRDNQQRQESGRFSQEAGQNARRAGENLLAEGRYEKKREAFFDRPRWAPPQLNDEPIPVFDCPWCGKPIKDLSAAVSDKNTGEAVHFDCVIARLSEGENLESGDAVCYIGGGRFGVVHFNNHPDGKDFKIKKIFEWENKDDRSEWRRSIISHFSVT